MRGEGVRGGHPTAAELMLYRDGEMGWVAKARVRRHLRGCAGCRERMAEQDAVMGQVRGMGEEGWAEGARLRLLTRMREEPVPGLAVPGGPRRRRWMAVAAMGLVLVGVGGYARWTRVERTGVEEAAWPKPDVRLTPGATRAVSLEELCPPDGDGGGEDQDPRVGDGVEQRVFREYGMGDAPKQNYQVDYLISPQLGGTADLRNLWPQPYGARWNAQAKDRLERRLHEMVCHREIDLRAAQEAIATDWIAAYRQVFHTAAPV